jgi:hypothetical protein
MAATWLSATTWPAWYSASFDWNCDAHRRAIAGEARHASGVDLGERRDPGARADQDGGRRAHQ